MVLLIDSSLTKVLSCLLVPNLPVFCISANKQIYISNGDQISVFLPKTQSRIELINPVKSISTKYLINQFIMLGNTEDKLLCFSNISPEDS